ncbi:GtrA family protein [Nocardia goodfellowii]|uniref:Flippase GtrA n=1 Tax=Nocardia goodfellowii TaxID=882446 RepID=A0ABS4QAC5_9NOCA|nr:GtrA family protein [Nocardia goodfellowii]MBP2188654.1 putative flippase GtrA [Nocardia goodfellowii]
MSGPLKYLRGDRATAQLIRFAAVGGFANLGYLLPFLLLYGSGVQLANLVGSILSTVLANELHRRLTFRSATRTTWYSAQLKGGGTAVAALAASSGTLALLGELAPGLRGPGEAAAVMTVSGIVGGLRFLSLRHWVFRAAHVGDVAVELVQPRGGGGVARRAPVAAW